MKIKPLSDHILVRRVEAQEKTAGGILLPDNARTKPQKGKVLAVGPGRLLKDGKRRGLQVKEGDTILFTSWAGDEYRERGGDNLLVMREEDVLAVVDEYLEIRNPKSEIRNLKSEIQLREAEWLRSKSHSIRKPARRCAGALASWPAPSR
jgi:chaperonin GroES